MEPPVSQPPETQERQKSVMQLVMQFFTIPLAIVLICIGIFYFFGRMAYDKKGIDDYLNEMKTASASRRWHAAYELSKEIGRIKLGAGEREKVAAELARLYGREKDEEDPRLRRYVVLGLSGLAHPSSFSLFEEALADPDPDIPLYALWGLAALKNPAAVPAVQPYLEKQDPAQRKMAAYALGVLGDRRASPALKRALEDAIPDVQWNAALALAQLRDLAAIPMLHQMLDRTYLDRQAALNESQKIEVMQNALRGVLLLRDKTARPLVEKLLQTESNPKLTEDLRKALDTLNYLEK